VFIYEALVDAGFDVTDAAPFYEWDGVSPDVNDFDVVVYLQGADWEDTNLLPAADAALTAWMLAGGTVIRSEWVAYEIGQFLMDETDFDQYMPVEATGGPTDYEYNTTWTVDLEDDLLVAGVPATWVSAGGGCTPVEAEADAVVVAVSDLCGPALTYKAFGTNGGRVIHINDDFSHDESVEAAEVVEPDPNTMAILLNAVASAGL
jgi:hypothetical protein